MQSQSKIQYPELLKEIATKTGVCVDHARIIIDAYHQIITESCSEGRDVQIYRFGTYSLHNSAPRRVVNNAVATTVFTEAKRRLKFKSSGTLTDLLTHALIKENDQ